MLASLDRGPLPGSGVIGGGVAADGPIEGTGAVDAGAGVAVIVGALTVTVWTSAGGGDTVPHATRTVSSSGIDNLLIT
jgi:hypothetical protein